MDGKQVPRTVEGALLLAGSGEFLPVMDSVDRAVLESLSSQPPRVAILPTAAGLDDPHRWIDMGVRHFAALGAHADGVGVYTRRDAEDPRLAAKITEADFLYYSGGNPAYVVSTLCHSLVWQHTVTRWQAGAALAGCSAGAMMLGGLTHDPTTLQNEACFKPIPGLGLLPHWFIIPHYERGWMFGRYGPAGLRQLLPPSHTIVGIEEDTALVRLHHKWSVWGDGKVVVLPPNGQSHEYRAGDVIPRLPSPRSP